MRCDLFFSRAAQNFTLLTRSELLKLRADSSNCYSFAHSVVLGYMELTRLDLCKAKRVLM